MPERPGCPARCVRYWTWEGKTFSKGKGKSVRAVREKGLADTSSGE